MSCKPRHLVTDAIRHAAFPYTAFLVFFEVLAFFVFLFRYIPTTPNIAVKTVSTALAIPKTHVERIGT